MITWTINKLEQIARTDVRYLVRGFFWFGVQHLGSIVGALAVAIAFANLLPKETYGLYQYILSIFALLGITTITRIDDSISISVAKGFEGDLIKVWLEKIKWGFLGSLAGLALATYWYLNDNITLALSGIIMALFVPLFEPPSIYNGYLIGKKHFVVMSLLSLINIGAHSLAIIATILLTKNIVWIITIYMMVNSLIRTLCLWYVYILEKPNNLQDPKTLSYGKKLSIIEIIASVSAQIDNILLFHYLGPVEVAAYAFIRKLPEQIKVIPKYLTTLSTPKFSTKDIHDQYVKKETTRKSIVLFLTLLGAAIVYIIAAPFIFSIFFRPYREYVHLSQIFALAMPLNFGGLWFNFIETSRREDIVFKLNIISPSLRIIIIFVSIKYFGLVGLVWGFLATRFLISALRGYFFYRA
ncbi:MAG: oligosaccharide flippase family protein [Patescibacteria group bacterium]